VLFRMTGTNTDPEEERQKLRFEGFKWAVLMGDIRMVCWPCRWISREPAEDAIKPNVKAARIFLTPIDSGVDGRSSTIGIKKFLK